MIVCVQVRLPTKSDKPGTSRGPEMDIAKKSVRITIVDSLPPVYQHI